MLIRLLLLLPLFIACLSQASVQPSITGTALNSNGDLLAAFEERRAWLIKREVFSSQTSAPEHINQLIHSDSPYLLSHSLQPVNWLEWQPNFESDFQSEGKLVFISIGYSTCHWCHVMADESFASPEVAKILNHSYINIKVDREQWPLVDERFKSALELLKGEAGWPLNVILTPDGKIVWIDSYLTKDKFSLVIEGLAKRWKKKPQAISSLANRIDKKVNASSTVTAGLESKLQLKPLSKNDWRTLLPEQHQLVYQALINDNRLGEPRFFREIWQLGLLDEYLRTGNKDYLEAVEKQLDEILLSPVFDSIDGGFHRYTVDSDWQTPHFEKMLYTQANMITLLAKAYGITGKPHYRIAMEQSIGWVEKWLKNDVGYASAVSAMSESEEGKYYHFAESITNRDMSNFDGFKLLDGVNQRAIAVDAEGLLALDSLDSDWRYSPSFDVLKKQRKLKIKPNVDEKVIVSWNSRYAIALIDAYEVTDNIEYLNSAAQLLESLWSKAKVGGELFRTVFHGRPSIEAQLEDYSLFATAQLKLAFYQSWSSQPLNVRGIKQKDDQIGEPKYKQKAEKDTEARSRRKVDSNNLPDYGNTVLEQDSAESRGTWLLIKMLNNFNESNGESLQSSLIRSKADGEQPSVYNSVYEALSLGQLYFKNPIIKLNSKNLSKQHSSLPTDLFKNYSFVSSVAKTLRPVNLQHAIFAKGHGRITAKYSDSSTLQRPKETYNSIIYTVSFDMEEGWHVNANPVSNSRFIPTTVTLASDISSTNSQADIKYPQAVFRQLGFSESDLALYEGEFEITLEGGKRRTTGEKQQIDSIDIRVQACSEQLCLLPELIKLNL